MGCFKATKVSTAEDTVLSCAIHQNIGTGKTDSEALFEGYKAGCLITLQRISQNKNFDLIR